MARSRITLDGVVRSYYEVLPGATVTVENDGDGGETSVLWVALTGSQPSGSFDGFADPLDPTTSMTVNKEGSYLIQNIVNGSITGSAVVAVKQLKSNFRMPAAGEKTEESGSYGWARAIQKMGDVIDGMYADGGTVVARARVDIPLRQLVRPSGSHVIKSGLPGAERVLEFSRVAGEATGSIQSTLYIAERGLTSSVDPIPSGTLFVARLYGLAGPFTGTNPAKGDFVFPRADGVVSLSVDTVDRKIGTVVDVTGSTYFLHFAGFSDFRPVGSAAVAASTGSSIKVALTGVLIANTPHEALNFSGSGGIATIVTEANRTASISFSGSLGEIDVKVTGALGATSVLTLNFTGSGGTVVSVSETPAGTALINISGSAGSAPTSLDVQLTGAVGASAVSVLNLTGSGGIVISVTETPAGTAFIDISGSLLAGPTGPAGPTGSAGPSGSNSIVVQLTGSTVAGSPFTTMSFSGSLGVSAAAGIVTVYSQPDFLFALLPSDQEGASGSVIPFTDIRERRGISGTDGTFTLNPFKAYNLRCGIGINDSAAGAVLFSWRNMTTGEDLLPGGRAISTNAAVIDSPQPAIDAVLQCNTASINVAVRVAGETNTTEDLRRVRSWVFIREI